jgi:hypothetical protein
VPRVEILENFTMGAVKGQEIEERERETSAIETWTLIFVDRQTGDQIRIGFRREARDELVRQLTGGIVLAGGELPRV